MTRYIIHLLPEEGQRRALDDLRQRIAEAIGHNRALDYPTAHITLVSGIEDGSDDLPPLDAGALAALLERQRGAGQLVLPLRQDEGRDDHALLALRDTAELAALRLQLYEGARAIAAGPDGRGAARAGQVRQQTWPHLTLAQEIAPDHWQRAMEIIAAAGAWVHEPIQGAEVALLARDTTSDQPYRITRRVPLEA